MTKLQKDHLMILLESIDSRVQLSFESFAILNNKIDNFRDELKEDISILDCKIMGLSGRVDAVEKNLTEKIDAVDKKVNALDKKVDALDKKVDALDKKVDALDKKVDALDKKVDALDKRVDALDKKVDALDKRVDALDKRVDALDKKVDALDKKVDAVDKKVDAVDKKVDAVEKNLAERIDAVYEELVAHRNDTEQHAPQAKRTLKNIKI